MKKYILIFTAASAMMFASCSSDYLDTVPNDQVSTSTAFSTTENCALALNGVAKMMTQQYLSSQGMNGEGTIMNWYNNYTGNDTQKCNLTGWSSIINNLATYKNSKTSSYGYYPWYYYYKIIGNVNQVIDNVDAATGTDSDKAFIKGQALTYRAYAFYRLATLYSVRWCDSENGAANGVVLRINSTNPVETLDMPLSTLGETFAQIYKDIDDAIALFGKSEGKRGANEFYLPDLSVAYAVKARAALYREDWATAAECAAKARAGYKLMSAEEYAAGFNAPNSEWMWGVYEAEDQTLYYYSYFAYIGANSSASICRSYPFAISKELIDKIPATDVRRNLYLVPQSDKEFKEMNSAGRTTKGTMFTRGKESGYVYSTSYIFGYMQFKLRAAFMPGGGSFNMFRASEMYYIEAEADCHLGKDSEAQQLLYDVTKRFDASYTKSSKTGAELLDEVTTYRRFDFFGEGFDWTDFKRWNKDIVRKKLEVSKGLASPGSFHSTFAITIKANEYTRWQWAIPNKETDYNDLIAE